MQRVVAISKKSFTFVVSLMALFGGVIGLIVGVANGSGFWGALLGVFFAVVVSLLGVFFERNESAIRYTVCAFLVLLSFYFLGPVGLFLGLFLGWFLGWFLFWLRQGRYRNHLQPYLSPGQVLWHYTFRVICGIIFTFLITPILVAPIFAAARVSELSKPTRVAVTVIITNGIPKTL